MKYVAAYMLLGVVVCLVIFCAYELNEMRKCAKQYAEAKMRFDAMIWREASELKNELNEMRKCAKQYAEAKTRFDATFWREASKLKNKMEGTDETRT